MQLILAPSFTQSKNVWRVVLERKFQFVSFLRIRYLVCAYLNKIKVPDEFILLLKHM